jgi:WD40 repeat protein
MDSKIKFIDLEKCKVSRVFNGHKKGVHAFDFCQSGKFIASCGMSREVIVWNPYTMQLITTLHGHISPVQEVCVDEEHSMLISLSVDKMIKVWDTSTLICEQTIYDQTQHRPENRLATMVWDSKMGQLVTASSYLMAWPMKRKTSHGDVVSHQFPICGALYNPKFQQIVSADESSAVHVWNLDSGQMVFKFKDTAPDLSTHSAADDMMTNDVLQAKLGNRSGMGSDGNNSKITAICFDGGMRRLVTGSHDGCVKLWNFNNGQCLRQFVRAKSTSSQEVDKVNDHSDLEGNEVTCVTYINEGEDHKFIVCTGWDRYVHLFPDLGTNNPEVSQLQPSVMSLPSTRHKELRHLDDILCLVHVPGGMIASCGFDGTIIVWTLDSGLAKMQLDPQGGRYDAMSPDGLSQGSLLDESFLQDHLQAQLMQLHPGSPGAMKLTVANPEDGGTEKMPPPKNPDSRKSSLGNMMAERNVIESLVYIDDIGLLVSGGGDGMLRFWSIKYDGKLELQIHAGHPQEQAITAMACDLVVRQEESQPSPEKAPPSQHRHSKDMSEGGLMTKNIRAFEESATNLQPTESANPLKDMLKYKLSSAAQKAVNPAPSSRPSNVQKTLLQVLNQRRSRYIVTGDSAGWVKVWDIENLSVATIQQFLLKWTEHQADMKELTTDAVKAVLDRKRRTTFRSRRMSSGGGPPTPRQRRMSSVEMSRSRGSGKGSNFGVKSLGQKSEVGPKRTFRPEVIKALIKFFQEKWHEPAPAFPMKEQAMWKAHTAEVVSIELFSRQGEDLLLSGGSNGIISLWTMDGCHVGIFGQPKPWSIPNRSSWRSLVSDKWRKDSAKDMQVFMEQAYDAKLGMYRRQEKKMPLPPKNNSNENAGNNAPAPLTSQLDDEKCAKSNLFKLKKIVEDHIIEVVEPLSEKVPVGSPKKASSIRSPSPLLKEELSEEKKKERAELFLYNQGKTRLEQRLRIQEERERLDCLDVIELTTGSKGSKYSNGKTKSKKNGSWQQPGQRSTSAQGFFASSNRATASLYSDAISGIAATPPSTSRSHSSMGGRNFRLKEKERVKTPGLQIHAIAHVPKDRRDFMHQSIKDGTGARAMDGLHIS